MLEWAQWARAAKGGRPGAVVAVTGESWPAALARLCPQVVIKGAAKCSLTGALTLWLMGADELLLLVGEPAKHGSFTAGNYLPW